jgi:hypothetical protein
VKKIGKYSVSTLTTSIQPAQLKENNYTFTITNHANCQIMKLIVTNKDKISVRVHGYNENTINKLVFVERHTRQHVGPIRTPEAIMISQANSIVLLWLVPVLFHIVLPLTVLACWLLIKPFTTFKQHETHKETSPAGVDSALSAAKN